MQFASLRRCSSRGAGTVFTSAMVFSSRDASRNAACGIDICEQNIGCDQVLAAETDVAIIQSNRSGRIVSRVCSNPSHQTQAPAARADFTACFVRQLGAEQPISRCHPCRPSQNTRAALKFQRFSSFCMPEAATSGTAAGARTRTCRSEPCFIHSGTALR